MSIAKNIIEKYLMVESSLDKYLDALNLVTKARIESKNGKEVEISFKDKEQMKSVEDLLRGLIVDMKPVQNDKLKKIYTFK
jgi:hypothetical protein